MDENDVMVAGHQHPPARFIKHSMISRVKEAWASLAGVERLEHDHIVVNPASGLCPRGWVGLVRLGDVVSGSAPTDELAATVSGALGGTSYGDASLASVLDRLQEPGPVKDILGPAALFYPPDNWSAPDGAVEWVMPAEIKNFLAAASAGDRAESGLEKAVGPLAMVHAPDGNVAASAGFELWPNQVAHICVLTDARYREQGFAKAVGAAAVGRALDEGHLAQWRAGPPASRAVARAIRLYYLGDQLSLRL